MTRKIDFSILGEEFGELTVLGLSEYRPDKKWRKILSKKTAEKVKNSAKELNYQPYYSKR